MLAKTLGQARPYSMMARLVTALTVPNTKMLENQDLEPRTTELMVPAESDGSQHTEGAFAAIADAINTDAFARNYHPAIGGTINQHGWNLLWFGVVTAISAVFIWRGNITAIWVAGMVGGLADLGYLIFVDLPGFVNVLPGTAMTVIAGGAIALSLVMMRMSRRSVAA